MQAVLQRWSSSAVDSARLSRTFSEDRKELDPFFFFSFLCSLVLCFLFSVHDFFWSLVLLFLSFDIRFCFLYFCFFSFLFCFCIFPVFFFHLSIILFYLLYTLVLYLLFPVYCLYFHLSLFFYLFHTLVLSFLSCLLGSVFRLGIFRFISWFFCFSFPPPVSFVFSSLYFGPFLPLLSLLSSFHILLSSPLLPLIPYSSSFLPFSNSLVPSSSLLSYITFLYLLYPSFFPHASLSSPI